MSRAAVLFSALFAVSFGCERAPLDVACPIVGEGDLFLTEVRGPQTGDVDAYGEWFEIYNAGSIAVELAGLEIRVTRLDGSVSERIMVRQPNAIEPGQYAVLGREWSGQESEHVDYGYRDDMDRDLFDSGAIELFSCGARIDVAVYRNLPTKGTLSVDGAGELTAELNDSDDNWCVDAEEDSMTEQNGFRGTPGEANRPCT